MVKIITQCPAKTNKIHKKVKLVIGQVILTLKAKFPARIVLNAENKEMRVQCKSLILKFIQVRWKKIEAFDWSALIVFDPN